MTITLPNHEKSIIVKTLVVFSMLLNFKASAQYQPVPIGYRTGFYNNYYKNPDSALFYARKLAAKPDYMSFLRQALHDDLFAFFSDEFRQQVKEKAEKDNILNWKQKYAADMKPLYLTIGKMATDPDQQLAASAQPLFLWVSIQRIQLNLREAPKQKAVGLKTDGASLNLQQTQADNVATTKLVNSLITGPLAQSDLFQNKTAIYALLAYRDIEKNKSLQALSKQLLTAIINRTGAAIPKLTLIPRRMPALTTGRYPVTITLPLII